VSTLQDRTVRKITSLPKATPGSYIDFTVNPTITALTPLSVVAGYVFPAEKSENHDVTNLNTSGLLDILSVDFSRSLKDLAAVLNDLKRLAALGDLPITYRSSSSLRVHFPGCDADSVEKLCEEIGVQRGVVVQDEDFDAFVGSEIALLFPFAPCETASEVDTELYQTSLYTPGLYPHKNAKPIDWHHMLSPEYPQHEEDELSVRSEDSVVDDVEQVGIVQNANPWASDLSSPDGYGTMSHSPNSSAHSFEVDDESAASPLEYQDFEGIRRFIELCDSSRR